MDIDIFISLADRYQALGWAVQEQFKAVLEAGGPSDEQNPNALAMIGDFLRAVEPHMEEAVDVRSDILVFLRAARP